MRLKKCFTGASYWLFSTATIVIGFGMVVLAFINSPLQLQIALVLIGLGFISLGLVKIKQAQNESRDKERLDQIIAKLDEIKQELDREKQPEKSGTAVADIITSSLKYYADKMLEKKDE